MSELVWTPDVFERRIDEAGGLRKHGKIAQAIDEYNAIIVAARQHGPAFLSAAYAGRGAAKLALNFQSVHDPRENEFLWTDPANDNVVRGAIEDLSVAVELDPGHGWAQAQLGEAHRSFARDHFRLMSQARFDTHIDAALQAYERAEPLVPQHKTWLLAHTAAAHFHRFWRDHDVDTLNVPSLLQAVESGEVSASKGAQSIQRAKAGFEAAIEARPDYAWARRFYAFLLTCLGQYTRAEQELWEALRSDPTPYLNVKRSMAMLYRYCAEEQMFNSPAHQECLERALIASREAMAGDSDDFFAMYVHAAASAEMQIADAEPICREARDGILNQVVRGILMAFALHHEGGDPQSFKQLLFQTIDRFKLDPEILTIARHDYMFKSGRRGRSETLLQAFAADWSAENQ